MLTAEDRGDLEVMRRVTGYTLDVCVRKGANICEGVVPFVVTDVLNAI